MEENTLRERKKLFQSLVVGDNTAAELLESAERLGIDLSAPWYNIIWLKTQSLRHAQDEYSGSLIRIEEELRSLEDGTTVVSFDRNLEGKAFLLKAESEEQLQLQQQEYIEKIKDIMEKQKQAEDKLKKIKAKKDKGSGLKIEQIFFLWS